MNSFINPKQLISQLPLEKGMQIADFGCGTGQNTIEVAKIIGSEGKMHAVDVLESALQSVGSQAKINNLNNIELIRANLEVLNSTKIQDASLDMVLAINMLFQSPNQEAIIQESIRVLKQGGFLIVVDWQGTCNFGPDTPYRTSIDQIKKLVNINFEKNIEVGDCHFGLIFKKQ